MRWTRSTFSLDDILNLSRLVTVGLWVIRLHIGYRVFAARDTEDQRALYIYMLYTST